MEESKDKENNNQTIDNRVRKRYQQLIEEGSLEIGVCPFIDPNVPPEWFDESKFKRAQKTADKYLIRLQLLLTNNSLKWASFSGLILGIQIPLFLEPLLTNGNHDSVSKLFKRYLDTDMKVSSWYENDPFDESGEAYKSLRKVRAMHKSIFKTMNNLTSRSIGSQRLWVSQCQMVLTQAGFFGLLITHTSSCFAHGISDSELEDIIYLWRVLGYLNGIQDKYNLCTYDNLEDTRAYLLYIADQFLTPQVSLTPHHPYPIGFQVAEGVAQAFRPVVRIRWQVFIAYWYNILGLSFTSAFKLSWFHWTLLQFTKFVFNWVLRFRFVYNLVNDMSKKRVKWGR
ncbi:uncharacterized protein LOC107369673 isoform X1 [Tetranychus urticae]|uniref:uncharacterized protein LOC107369673 isoform X1 n=1 Tax=Tetranychus urticae TaxID=32264 RepID=UPI00077BB5F9|nr:uncharacterized protein LOC107369673 isoform X1 [Tetranychus urticae]